MRYLSELSGSAGIDQHRSEMNASCRHSGPAETDLHASLRWRDPPPSVDPEAGVYSSVTANGILTSDAQDWTRSLALRSDRLISMCVATSSGQRGEERQQVGCVHRCASSRIVFIT